MRTLLFLLLLTACTYSQGHAQKEIDTLQAQPVRVIDGDTYEVQAGTDTLTLRLAGVDAPETSQPYGEDATRVARELIGDRPLTVLITDTGYYGRYVARVRIKGFSLSRLLVSRGMAWVSPQYCEFDACDKWRDIQAKRRSQNMGLWAQAEPVPPWEYR